MQKEQTKKICAKKLTSTNYHKQTHNYNNTCTLSTAAQSRVTSITVFQRERQPKSLQSQQHHNNDYKLLIDLSYYCVAFNRPIGKLRLVDLSASHAKYFRVRVFVDNNSPTKH
jgi:hypothetical protein